MPWYIGLVQAPTLDICPWVTWHPATTLASGGNNPLPLDQEPRDPTGFDAVIDFSSLDLPSYEGPEFYPCHEGWYVLNVNWDVINTIANDVQTYARSATDFDDPGQLVFCYFAWSMNLGFGINIQFDFEYSLAVSFSPGPGSLVNERWIINVEITVGGIVVNNDHISVSDVNVPTAYVPYPGFTADSTFWVHRTVASGPDGFGNYTYDNDTSHGSNPSFFVGDITTFNENSPMFYGGLITTIDDEDGSIYGSAVESLDSFLPVDPIASAGYWTGPGRTLGDLIL